MNAPAAPTNDQIRAGLTAPGAPFEMEEILIRGVPTRVWKNAPATLRDVFAMSANFADRDFIVYEGDRLTYGAFYKAAIAFAHVLRNCFNLQKGDRVAIAMRNFPEWPIAFFGTALAGGVAVPLNAWWTGPELEYGLADSGAKVAMVDGERAGRIQPHLGALPNLEAVILARPEGAVPPGLLLLDEVLAPFDKLASLPDQPLPDVPLAGEDNATIFYTSGTTGKPKGALGTHRNIAGNVFSGVYSQIRSKLRGGMSLDEIMTPQSQRAILLSVPLFHATGCHSVLCGSVFTGAKIVCTRKWDPLEALKIIEAEKINTFGGVPAIAWQVLEHPDFDKYDTSSIESVAYGGAPTGADLVERIKKSIPAASPGNGYGLTETSALMSQNLGVDYVRKPTSCGLPIAVCDVKVVDGAGQELPRGEVGELWIKGPNVVAGYWQKPEATAQTFSDGWLHSGDLAKIDDEGFIFILDRAKDMLIRGGENVYCVEVEDALYKHPAVMDAAVIGIPHKVLGEEVGAVVQVKPGVPVTEDDLRKHCAGLIAGFKVPVKIWIEGEPLPRNANGKILKRQLREEKVGA